MVKLYTFSALKTSFVVKIMRKRTGKTWWQLKAIDLLSKRWYRLYTLQKLSGCIQTVASRKSFKKKRQQIEKPDQNRT